MRELDDGDHGTKRVGARLILDRRFRFLNEERELVEIDWTAEYVSPLWTYHLHYFDYALDLAFALNETGHRQFRERYVELWSSWLDAGERGMVRMEPYPTSVRCLNALRSLWLVEQDLPASFTERLLAATHDQLDWLVDNLERHLRANHLQKNLTALTWGSLAFGDEKATRWRAYSDELWEELGEQTLPDGGHFERSPMYHAGVLDDYLRTLALCRAGGAAVPEAVPERLVRMTQVLQWLSRPDNTLHLFNDTANDGRPSRNAVVAVARKVLTEDFSEPSGPFTLRDTGYFGHVGAGGRRIVIDAGPPGPRYQPGHAHCDMLSFEFDLIGRPVVVDAGVHGYNEDPYREYVRSTRAHNTVAIDGREQHEVWGTFRVARRGAIIDASGSVVAAKDAYIFSGACRSFHDRKSEHRRTIELHDGLLTVSDRVTGAWRTPLVGWLHLHPDFCVQSTKTGYAAVAESPRELSVMIEFFAVDEIRIWRGEYQPVQGWHCPQFGVALPAPALEMRIHENDGRVFGYRLRFD